MYYIMSRQETGSRDLLKKYINREMIEKAPEGFTSKSMTRIHIENEISSSASRFLNRNRVPIISLVITAILIIAVIFLPSGGKDYAGFVLMEKLPVLKLTMPDFRFPAFPDPVLPGWVLYASASVILLALLDRAILGILSRRKS